MGCFSTHPQGSTSVTVDFLKQHSFSAHVFKLITELTNNGIFGLNTKHKIYFYCLKTYCQARGVGDTGYELDMILF